MSCKAMPVNCVLHREWYDESFGFNVTVNSDEQIEICKVSKGSPADGSLQLGDIVTSINDTAVVQLTRTTIAELCQGQLRLVVSVLRLSSPHGSRLVLEDAPSRLQSVGRLDALDGGVVEVRLQREEVSAGFGFGCGTTDDGQHYVTSIDDHVTDHQLLPGDRIVRIDGVEGDTLTDARLHELAELATELHLVVVRRLAAVDIDHMHFVAHDFNVGAPGGRARMPADSPRTSRVQLLTGDEVSLAESEDSMPRQNSDKASSRDHVVRVDRHNGEFGFELREVPTLAKSVRVLIDSIKPDASFEGNFKTGQQVLKVRRYPSGDQEEEWFDVSRESRDAIVGTVRALGHSIELTLSTRLYSGQGVLSSIRRTSHQHASMHLEHGAVQPAARHRGRFGRLVHRVHIGHRSNSSSNEPSPDPQGQRRQKSKQAARGGHKSRHGLFHMRKRNTSSTSHDVLNGDIGSPGASSAGSSTLASPHNTPNMTASASDQGLAASEQRALGSSLIRRANSFSMVEV
jgi:hypothetical protein